jgi:LPXTG-motif cell wall-anchored protein
MTPGGQVSGKRSTRTASVAAVVTAIVLGLFAASAFGWYDEGGGGDVTTPTETTPTETTPPPEEQPAPPPPLVETQPVSPQPVSSEITPAPPPEAAPAPALATLPEEGVKGEIGTRDEGGAESTKPTVLAQATDVGTPVASESSGGLAKTGFNVLFLAILGAVALAGSSLLFWRSRTA